MMTASEHEFWSSMPAEHLYAETNRILTLQGWRRTKECRWKWSVDNPLDRPRPEERLTDIGWSEWSFHRCHHPIGMVLMFDPNSLTIDMLSEKAYFDFVHRT